MTYANQLKTMRQARGLTQEELAANTGIPNTYLSMMETGKIIPAGEWEAKLRKALQWTPDTDALLGELLHHTSLAVTEKYASSEEQPA